MLKSSVYLKSVCERFLFMIISSMQWTINAYDCSALAINSVCLSAVIYLSLSPSLLQRFLSLGLGIPYTLLFENITLHKFMESNIQCHSFQLYRCSGNTLTKITWIKILNNSMILMHRYLKTHFSWLFRHIFKYNNWNVILQLFNKHTNRKQSRPSLNIDHFLAYIYWFPTPNEFFNNSSFEMLFFVTFVLNNQYQLTWFHCFVNEERFEIETCIL